MKINFVTVGNAALASFRYRILIPAQAMASRHRIVIGNFTDADVHVFSKHFDYGDAELARRCRRVVFDICDNHFGTRHGDHYRRMAGIAGVITCSTAAMRDVIRRETGRDALLIEDPYELPEAPPRPGQGRRLLWFGQAAGLQGMLAELPRLQAYETELVTQAGGDLPHTPWSVPNLLTAFERADFVVIPVAQDEQAAVKSANRAVESLRQGRFVVANPLRAYADLGIWQGDIVEGLEWARANPQEVRARLLAGQALVRRRFAPDKIGADWEAALASA